MNIKQKIFGIGFHKTGTTSLAKALSILGYRVTGPNWIADRNIGKNVYQKAFKLAEQYDAFQDNPWAVIFKELDGRFPGSKFILTIRPQEEWIKSVVNHFDSRSTPMREWIYGAGSPKGHETIYISRYCRHNQEVADYFKDRPGDLLVLKITEGEGWEKLCPFLNKGIPAIKFPNTNKAQDRSLTMIGKFKAIGGKLINNIRTGGR